MQIKAQQKNSRQSPRKVRLIADQVKGMSLEKAFAQLALMERNSTIVLLKVMRQAVANAVNNHQLAVEDLELENILVKTGPTYKRWQPVSRGRAHKILKRTCHVEVILKTKEQVNEKQELKQEEKAKSAKSATDKQVKKDSASKRSTKATKTKKTVTKNSKMTVKKTSKTTSKPTQNKKK